MKNKKLKLILAAMAISVCALIGGLTLANNSTTAYANEANSAIPLSETSPDDQTAEQFFTFTQTADGNGVSVKAKSTTISGSIVIPSSYNGVPVTEIKDSAFSNCARITGITIPSGITQIGQKAFYKCKKLKNMNYLGTLEQWVGINFADDTSNPTYFTKKLVVNGEEITKVQLSDGFTSIGQYAFSDCTNLTSVTIPSSVTSIGKHAFRRCSNLKDMNYLGMLEQWVGINFATETSNPVFCTNKLVVNGEEVTEAEIPSGVTTIGQYAFVGCANLTSVTIPSTVTTIGSGSFDSCENLTNVTIPSSVTAIEDYSFNACKMLTSITIPSGVVSLGNFAFYNCSSLADVTVSDGVKSIGNNAFGGCTSLSAITLPTSVTTIGRSAFFSCQSLAEVTMSDSVTSLGASAFEGCTSLVSVTIPSGVTSIASKVFFNCRSLAEVTMSDEVTKIGSSAFESCTNLVSVTIPQNVTAIDNKAFNNCYKLAEVCNASSLNITKGTDNGSVANYALNVYTPTSGESKIKTVNGYRMYEADEHYLLGYYGTETKLTLPTTEYEYEIYPYAFYQNGKIESVEFSSKVKSIGDYSFNNCANLESVSISESVTSIGTNSFFACANLAKVVIPNGVTSVGNFAFQNCTNLAEVTISETVTNVGQDAFSGCDNLQNMNYLGTLNQWVAIEFGSYRSNPIFYTKKLVISGEEVTRVTLSADVASVGNFAFYNCENLTSVTISSSVEKIGDNAFVNCTNLSKVTIESAAIYNSSTSTTTSGYLLNSAKIIYVPKTIVDDAQNTNSFLSNTFYFQKCEKDNDYVYVAASYTAEQMLFDATVEQSFASVYFNGNEQKPSITVKLGEITLTEGQDYVVIYPNDVTNVGEKKVIVEGIGNYIGDADFSYTILAQIDLSGAVVEEVQDKYYNGTEYRPQVVVKLDGVALVEGTDYDVTYSEDLTNVGEKTITLTGKGKYNGTKEVKYNVLAQINVATEVTFDEIADIEYTGENVTPQIVLKDGDKVLVEGVDYKVIYPEDMSSDGEKKITIEGMGKYSGTKEITVNVVKDSLIIPIILICVCAAVLVGTIIFLIVKKRKSK